MKKYTLVQITCLLFLAGGLNLKAASGSWTGATDATWAGANWSASPVPGTGDTATFNGLGNGNTTIDLGGGVTILNLLFNTGSAAAYTIGNGAVGSQTLTLNDSGAFTMNSTVANNELFSTVILLGLDATAKSYSIANNSGSTLTFAANISGGPAGGTAGIKTLTVGGTGNTFFGGNLNKGSASNINLAKTGSGTFTVNPVSNVGSASGSVTVSAGTLAIDFSNAGANNSLLSSFSPVTLAGGKLQIIGNPANASAQTFGGVTVNAGYNVISAEGTVSPTLTMAAFPQTLGSQTRFDGPATINGGGNLAVTATITTTYIGTGNNNQTAGAGTKGLLWNGTTRLAIATVGLYDWASTSKADGTAGTTPWTIIGGSQVSGFYTTISGTWANVDANYDMTASVAATGASTPFVDTVRFNTPAALTLGGGGGHGLLVGGILVTPNVGANNTSIVPGNGFIASSAVANNTTYPIDFYQNNTLGELVITAPIGDYGGTGRTTTYVQGGAGTVVLSGVNTYTKQSYLNGGVTVISANSGLGAVATGSQVNLNGGTLLSTASITLDNAGSAKRLVAVGSAGGGLAAAAGQTLTVDGQVTGVAGQAPLVIGIPASSANGNVAGLVPGTGSIANGQAVDTANTTPVFGTGTVVLNFPNGANGNSVYNVAIVGGATLNINSQYALGGANYSSLTFNSGTLQYATTLATGAAGTALDISGAPVTFTGNGTIDINGKTITYVNAIGNSGSGQLTVANSGSGGGLYLNGGSTHTGGTVVSSGAILGGSGTIGGNVTVNSGGETFPSAGSGATNTIGGNLTYNSGALAGFNLTTNATSTNDQIIVTGALSLNGVVHIKAPSTLSILDATADYVLITYGSSSGSFSSLVWDVQPANYNAYSISNDTVHKKILLHYTSSATAPTLIASASPSTLVRNQSTLVSATVTPGSGTVSSSGSVFLNAASIGLSGSIPLTLSATPNVYTNTITVPAGPAAGSYNLGVWVVDSTPLIGTNNFSLTINVSTETWNGGDYGTSANWSDNGNWVSTLAPGIVGDTLVFDGGTGPAPSLNNNYNVTSVTFAGTATTAFTIGTVNSSYLTLSAGGVTNNSSLTQTLNVPVALTAAQTLNAAAGALTLGQSVTNGGNLLTVADSGFSTAVNGGISGSGGLTKTGNGTLTLGAANNYTGTTAVNGGTVTVNGTGVISNSVSQIIVGNVAGNAILNINGGTVNANFNNNPSVALGNVSGANGFVFMSSGTFENGAGEFHIGQVTGAYGAFDLSGGNVIIGDVNAADAFFVVGGAFGASASQGVFNMSGGTFNDNAQSISIGGIAGAIGVANIIGGTINSTKGIHVGERGSGILNVSGSANANLTGGTLGFGGVNAAGQLGNINLLGGTVTANGVGKVGTTTVNARLNLNGGTLKAAADNATFLTGLNAATVYTNGVVIDDGGFAINIGQVLLAPTGNGVSTIPVSSGGTGYLDTPIVTISGGGGTGATAVANIAGGSVTSVSITSPGTGYTSAPTVTLTGGGFSSAATLGTATIAANVSGGLTKQGAGTLTLTGANSYTNLTTVNAGTLALQSASSATAGYVVTNGATLDVSAISPPTLSAGQSLSGGGTINGSITTSSGVNIYPATALPTIGTVGTLTFNNDLDLSGGGTCYFDISTTASSGNDQIVVGGTLTFNGGLLHLKALSGAANLDATADYVLFNNANSPNITTLPALIWDGTKPANAANYSLQLSGNNLVLHYATLSGPLVASVTVSPASVVRGQNVKFTATVTPGSGAINPSTGVTIDLSAFGGSPMSSLVLSNANVYTNTFTVPTSTAPGSQLLTVTATDANLLSGSGGTTLTVNAATDVWNGGDYGSSANWNDGANWVSTFAPGLVGDALVFAGTTGPSPSMENNYSVTSVTFTNGAGSFNIGTPSSTLTITAGGVTNNSANVQNLNVPVNLTTAAQSLNAAAGDLILGQNLDNGGNLLTVADGGHSTVLNGVVSGNGGLTKTGNGTLTLGGANNYSGTTTVNSGIVTVNGAGAISTTTSQVIVGNAAGNAILNIAGGSVSANMVNNPAFAIGNVTNANGFVFMSSGSLECGAGEFHIGQAAGAYGAFDLSGGTVTIGDVNAGDAYFVVGGAFGNSASKGVFNMSGGTLNDDAQEFSIANIAGAVGVANVSGGTLNDNKGIHVGDRGIGILNVSGSAVVNLTGGPLQFGISGNTTVGTVNLLGGLVTANNVGVAGTSTSRLNFNGGTLQAGAASATFMQGLTAATIYSGGALIDDGGNAITIAQPLLAPTGNGVSTIPVATGGAGYLDTPIVTISGGGGTGATAVANISGGSVTGVTITSPGVGYTSAPTVTLFGGGYTTAATLGTATLTANTSGGLIKQNSGTLNLTGANTYTGNTIINGGTLELAQPTLAENSTVTVASGAVLQLDFSVTNAITNLVLNGASQAPGIYNSTTGSPYFTGVGSLQVVVPVTIATNPTNITFSITGGNTLNLSWPADHLGWLVQSNSVNLAVPADWYDISNTATGTSYSITINPAKTNVFYRLRKP